MIEWNLYAWLILAIVVGLYALSMLADWLNLFALSPTPPDELADIHEGEAYRRSQHYTMLGTRLEMAESTVSLVCFLAFWLSGAFGWLDEWTRQQTDQPLVAAALYITVLMVLSYLVNLPFTLLDTFWLEERFGFNRTSPGTFALDQIKSVTLTALIGIPLFVALCWFFQRWPTQGWWIAWTTLSLLSLGLSYIAPSIILPLFNRFEPLGDGELKQRIGDLARRCNFPLDDIYVMDGSRRSSKSNAFFTGLGKRKRIALFDTLIQNHTPEELEAILAHEIGHFKKRHIQQRMVLGLLQVGLMCFLMGLVLNNPPLLAAFGVQQTSVYVSIVIFTVLYRPVAQLISIGMSILSRANEYEADRFAAQSVGSPQPLIDALRKLARENLSNLTPHRWYVFMHYSHPPLADRLAALRAVAEPAEAAR